jgi:hypothetical protein
MDSCHGTRQGCSVGVRVQVGLETLEIEADLSGHQLIGG